MFSFLVRTLLALSLMMLPATSQAQMLMTGVGPGSGGSGSHSFMLQMQTNCPFTVCAGSYGAYSFMFGAASPYVPVTDYNSVWTLQPGTFPNNSVLNWKTPSGAPNSTICGGLCGVWGGLTLVYANYDASLPKVTVTPQMMSDITSYTKNYSFTYSGVGLFDSLSEFWATQSAHPSPDANSNSAALYEIGYILHDPTYAFHNSGTVVGTNFADNGVTFSVRSHGTYYTIANLAGVDVASGSLNEVNLIKYLTAWGAVSGSEWINGENFGIEPQANTVPNVGQYNVVSYAASMVGNTGGGNADYLGTNLFPDTNDFTGWTLGDVTSITGQADFNGGTSAILLQETATTATHGPFIVSTTVPSRALDLVWFEDILPNKGRNFIELFLSDTAFSNQLVSVFDTTALTTSTTAQIGSLTLVTRQIIDLGNGWRRIFVRAHKPSGITTIFTAVQLMSNATTTTYLGDVTKGMTFRVRNRLSEGQGVTLTGTCPAGNTSAAYTCTPTIVGGQDPISCGLGTGALPTGWSINSTTCVVSGTTTVAGTYNFSIRATYASIFFSDLPETVMVTTVSLPTNTVAPTITNPSVQATFTVQGMSLTCNNGTWTGSPTFAYEWRHSGTIISGQTAQTYTVQSGDNALLIDCGVTGNNIAGSVGPVISSNNATGIAGTLMVNEQPSSQGAWGASGGWSYTLNRINASGSTSFNGIARPISGLTAGKTLQIIHDQSVTSGDFQFQATGATNPNGTDRATTGTAFTDSIVIPASPTGIKIQNQAAGTTGWVQNILAVQLP